ncbi:hypothetical protein FACS189454_10030 [Planctomycetales bacterium]|nr:hypothetical protein FACS189454_10030 [Planctomycetales bacterium]
MARNLLNAEWKAKQEILKSVPGVGEVVSTVLLAELPELGNGSADSVSTLVGVVPMTCQSGVWKGKSRIIGGRGTVRCALYDGGAGCIDKQGTGILTLSGANGYSGGTTVSEGLINFNNAGNFGTGNIALNGGGLQWATNTYTDISDRLNSLDANGGIFDTNGNDVSFANAISGDGSLTKTGAGTLTLTGTNSYSGGTTVSEGTLEVTGTLGNGNYAGNIVNNSTLVFNQNADQTLSGVIDAAVT